MILYLESSALVKLFVVEARSDQVRQAISRASLIATHAIACVEACATFARAAHARGVSAKARSGHGCVSGSLAGDDGEPAV